MRERARPASTRLSPTITMKTTARILVFRHRECWCARAIEESTDTFQSTRPAPVGLSLNQRNSLSHVPSVAKR
jgi:hypothetical protein